MMKQEIWDLYSAQRQSLGQTVVRGQPHAPGTYHIVVGLWVLNRQGQLLLTLRDLSKPQYAGLWENQGGSAQSGEDSLTAACRELGEETGLTAAPQALTLLGSLVERTSLVDVYALRCDAPLSTLRLQPGETTDARWASLEQLWQLERQGRMSAASMRRLRAVWPAFARFWQSSLGLAPPTLCARPD